MLRPGDRLRALFVRDRTMELLIALANIIANAMDRETIENVLNAVSPSCKEEMEVALTSPSEISDG